MKPSARAAETWLIVMTGFLLLIVFSSCIVYAAHWRNLQPDAIREHSGHAVPAPTAPTVRLTPMAKATRKLEPTACPGNDVPIPTPTSPTDVPAPIIAKDC